MERLFFSVIVLISCGIVVGSIPVVLISNYTFAASTAEVIIPHGASSASSDHFKPQTIKVPKRTTVEWINNDDTLHTVTSGTPDSGNSGTEFDSSYLGEDKTFMHQFNKQGTYKYYCTLHPFMVGKIVVSQNSPHTISSTEKKSPRTVTSAESEPAIQSDTIVTTNRLYRNPDYDLKIQYPVNWKLSEHDLPSNGIVSFTAPDTKTIFEPAIFLIANFQMQNGTTLDQFVNFFLEDRYKNSTDHKLLTQADTVLDGMPARQLLLYDYDEGLIGSGTTGKVLRILALDNTTNNGYAIKFWSQPQVFDKYLPIAKKMISSFLYL